MTQGTATYQSWKDATPTNAWDIGMTIPGGSVGNDLNISDYNGSSWSGVYKFRDADKYFEVGVGGIAVETVVSGTSDRILIHNDSNNHIEYKVSTDLTVGAGGSNTQVQFNDNGALEGASNVTIVSGSVATLQTTVKDYGSVTSFTVDFTAAPLQKMTTAGSVSPSSSSNREAGRSVTLLIDNSAGAQRSFSFNSSWKFIGEKPAAIAANKIGILSLTAFGTAETDVVCSYGVQD